MKFKEGFRISSRINIIVGVMRGLFLEKRGEWLGSSGRVQPSEAGGVCWPGPCDKVKGPVDPWNQGLFPQSVKGFFMAEAFFTPVKKYLFCVLWPKDISRWFRKVDESCLLSMKMNGQDFSKKQSLTKIHPSCLTGRPVNSISCTWLFFLHQSKWRVYHILTFYIFRQPRIALEADTMTRHWMHLDLNIFHVLSTT